MVFPRASFPTSHASERQGLGKAEDSSLLHYVARCVLRIKWCQVGRLRVAGVLESRQCKTSRLVTLHPQCLESVNGQGLGTESTV
jgi:hypothetical protein